MGSKDKPEIYPKKYIDVSKLKGWAARSLSPKSSLRALLLLEKDTLPVDEFLSKMETWLKLSRIETQNNPEHHRGI